MNAVRDAVAIGFEPGRTAGLRRCDADEDGPQAAWRRFADNPTVMLLLDPQDGRVVDANRAAAEFYGWTQDDLVGASLAEVDTRSDGEIQRSLTATVEAGHGRFEWRHRAAGGQVCEVEVCTSRLEWGGEWRVQAVVHDITEWRLAVERERRASAGLRLLWHAVEQSPASIVITDTRGLIEYVNPKFSEITGYTSAEALGQNPRILKGEALPSEVYADLWRTIASGQNWRGEFCNRRKDGRLFWESALIAPVRDANGAISHFLAIKEDITARKLAEEELRSTNLQLEEATARANRMAVQAELSSAAKSDFLANVSHEIRTPLNGVLGMSGLLLETPLTAEQRHYAELLRNGGQILLALINDILDFSKIEAGKLELESVEFDLRESVEDTVDLLAVKAAGKGIELVCGISPDVPGSLRGDAARLRQILLNLGGNAIKFTGRGEVVIWVNLEDRSESEAVLRFTVRDTGIGIPADRRAAIFSPFGQAEASTSRRFGGTGLGLAISRQLAERMRGGIGFESEEGKGSTFWFTAVFGLAAVREPDGESEVGRHPRVLLVEGHPASRTATGHVLARLGYRFTAVADGGEARDALGAAQEEGDPYQVILVDPSVGGLSPPGEACGGSGGDTTMTPRWIQLHALGAGKTDEELMSAGYSGRLAKPFRQAQLKAVLRVASDGKVAGCEGRKPASVGPEPKRILEGLRILVVDDHPTNQLLATTLIQKRGGVAGSAIDGQAAIEALQRATFDLVLMDCRMPGMDGFEATRRIRGGEAGRRNASIPILAVSASAMVSDREECRRAGMDDFIAKPVQPERLEAALLTWGRREVAGGDAPAVTTTTGPVSAEAEGPRERVFDRPSFLVRMQGDLDLARGVASAFLTDLPGQAALLRKSVEDAEWDRAREIAHRLKGAAATVGGQALHRVSCELERLARDGAGEELRSLLGEWEEEAESLGTVLHSFCQG